MLQAAVQLATCARAQTHNFPHALGSRTFGLCTVQRREVKGGAFCSDSVLDLIRGCVLEDPGRTFLMVRCRTRPKSSSTVDPSADGCPRLRYSRTSVLLIAATAAGAEPGVGNFRLAPLAGDLP